MWNSYKDQVSTITGICQDKVMGHAERHLSTWKIDIRGAERTFNARTPRDVRHTLAAHGATEILVRYEVINCKRSIETERTNTAANTRKPKQNRQLMKLEKVIKDLKRRSVAKKSTEIRSWKKGTAARYRSRVHAAPNQVGDS